jgi:serine/threonine protein kinase
MLPSKLLVDLEHLSLMKIIGTGGFGTVYSALHTDYSSWYAVKRVGKVDLLKHTQGVDMIMVSLCTLYVSCTSACLLTKLII